MSEKNADTGALFSWRAAILTVIIGAISFSSLVVLSAFAPDLQDKDHAGLHAYSRSALGYNLAVQLLKRTGHEVEISRDPELLEYDDTWGSLVLTPAGPQDLEEMKRVEFDRYEPTLIILPKRQGFASFSNPRHQRVVTELGLNDVTELLQPFGDTFSMRRINAVDHADFYGERMPVAFTERTQIISGGPIIPILRVEEGTIFGRIEDTNVYIAADPELFNTHGLKSLDNAKMMIRLFDEMDENEEGIPFLFDTTLHGFERTRNLLKLLFQPPLLGATLFMTATALLLGWSAFVRFGKPPPAKKLFATGRGSLIESTAGLFSQTRQDVTLASDYGQLAERLAVKELGYPNDLSAQQIQNALAQAEQRQDDKGNQHSERPDATSVQTAGQLVSFAQAYHQWKKDMSDGRK